MGLSPHTGKALDASGAFAFLAFACFFAALGLYLFAISFAVGVVAWIYSWMAWHALDGGNEFLHHRRAYWVLVWAIASAVIFIVAVVVWVLT